jgi:hypothetical protein
MGADSFDVDALLDQVLGNPLPLLSSSLKSRICSFLVFCLLRVPEQVCSIQQLEEKRRASDNGTHRSSRHSNIENDRPRSRDRDKDRDRYRDRDRDRERDGHRDRDSRPRESDRSRHRDYREKDRDEERDRDRFLFLHSLSLLRVTDDHT